MVYIRKNLIQIMLFVSNIFLFITVIGLFLYMRNVESRVNSVFSTFGSQFNSLDSIVEEYQGMKAIDFNLWRNDFKSKWFFRKRNIFQGFALWLTSAKRVCQPVQLCLFWGMYWLTRGLASYVSDKILKNTPKLECSPKPIIIWTCFRFSIRNPEMGISIKIGISNNATK